MTLILSTLRLDVSKSNGHDDISAQMLKETALSMTPAVQHLDQTWRTT
jgi:hypothetical protein